MSSSNSAGVKTVGINAHLLSAEAGYRRAGIHVYISQLLNHLPQEEETLTYHIFTNSRGEISPMPGRTIESSRLPTQRPIVRILWEQMLWPLAAARQKLDLLHSPAFVTPVIKTRPAIVTVYDLSFIHYPERFPPLQRAYLTSQTRRSCHQARRVVTISASGRQDVHECFGLPLDKIEVVHPGVESIFCPVPADEVEAFRKREQLPNQFILHVGTLQPRKNIPLLISAFARLEQPELELVLVGGKGWSYQEIYDKVTELGLEKRVRFAGYVPDDELPLWYNAASVLVLPSVYEGFGMPVAQAMACGTPVIAAETSSLPEAAGGAARLFDPQDEMALAEQMVTVLDDSQIAAKMRQQGLTQAQHFSWQQAGQKMAAIYQRTLAEL